MTQTSSQWIIGVGGIISACLIFALPARADEPDLHALSLEVQALQTLRDLELSQEQLAAVAKLAEGAGMKEKPSKKGTASAAYRNALTQYRDALIKQQEDKIIQLRIKVDELVEKENIDVDDRVTVTPVARQRATQFLKLINVHQLSSFIGSLSITEPVERIMDGAEEIAGLTGKDKDEVRDDVAREVGWLVGGPRDVRKVRKQVADFLDRASAMKEDDIKKKRADLEKEAKQIVGDVGAMELLQHGVEHGLAELLANPRLDEALAALKKK